MKKLSYLLFIPILTVIVSCGSMKTKENTPSDTELISEANKVLLPLFNQIIRLNGISGSTGVPMFITNKSVLGTGEPLYVLDGNIIGSSFDSVKDVVNSIDIKKIKSIKGADASYYGSRGANGVILITTK